MENKLGPGEERKLSVLRRISAAVGKRFELEPILNAAVEELGRASGASRSYFYWLDASGFMRVASEYTSAGVSGLGVGNDVLTPVSYMARQISGTVGSDHMQSDPRFGESMDQHLIKELAIQSELASPVIFHGIMLGLIGLYQCDRSRKWSDDDVELLELVASHLAVLIQSVRMFAEQENQSNALASMNEDLSRLYVELARKDAQMGKFMHLISHDLRAPVVAVQGLTEALKKDYEDEPVDSKPRRYLELITHSADQIGNLTSALLDFVKLGQSSLTLTEIDTEELVKEIWQRLSISVADCELEIFGSLPVVQADYPKLVRIFQNLLENAIKYRKPEGRLVLDVMCQSTDTHWQFAVNDNGIGFHPSVSESLFDLFTRLKTARDKPGSGIGLSSVVEIARLHGGTAWAIGRPGKGATFYFSIAKRIAEKQSGTIGAEAEQ